MVAKVINHNSSVCKLFQISSSLKPLNQFEPNLDTIIMRVSSLKFVSGVLSDQPTWLSLLKVEHRGKINNKLEKKIFEKVYRRTTTEVRRTPSDGNSSHDLLASSAKNYISNNKIVII
jgi:hypothetical protein